MEFEPDLLKQSTRLLELFALQIDSRFDRQLARKILLESYRNESQKPYQDWVDTVASCAESMEIRIRRVETNFKEILPMVRNGFPVATLVGESSREQAWWLLTRVKGGKIEIVDLRDGRARWVKQANLAENLGFESLDDIRCWLVCYPVFMGDAVSASDHHHQPVAGHENGHAHGHSHGPPPLRRILRILRPERADIWTILLFSFVVGLLTLTTPIATEALVNTVAFGVFIQPVIVLAIIVLVFLGFSSALSALQIYVMEILQRRLFVRLVDDLAYRLPRVCQDSVDQIRLSELTNRFLDIVMIQKSLAKLLLDGAGLIIQAVIGMIVLGFYHPFLLGFDIVLLACVTFTLFVLGRGGVATAINESFQKYETLKWLQELGRCPTAFKLNDGLEFAVERADQLAVDYIRARKMHFAIYMRQVVFSLAIYAVAMTSLLGLGGWLVISGELSLGQLIAAELIVVLIMRSFTKLGTQLESFYDLMAATDKVGVLLDLPIEDHDKLLDVPRERATVLRFDDVSFAISDHHVIEGLSMELAEHDSFIVIGDTSQGLHYLGDLVLGLRSPSSGVISFCDVELREFRLDSLRSMIGVAREGNIFEGTLEENIHLNRPQVSMLEIRRVVEELGLLKTINELHDGFGTRLSSSGFPLTPIQAKRLVIARALAGRPRLLVLDRILDSFSKSDAQSIVQAVARYQETTLLVISARPDFVDLGSKSVILGDPGN